MPDSNHTPGATSADATHDVARVGDRYTSDAMICSTCRGLLIRPHETVEENTPAPYDFKTIAQSACEGCPLCELFFLELMRDDSPELLGLQGLITFWYNEHGEIVGPRAIWLMTDKDDGPYRLLVPLLLALSCGANSQAQNTVTEMEAPSTFSVKTPIEAINTGDGRCLEMVTSWLQTCRTHHRVCNAGPSLGHSAVRPTRVIDASVATAKLVTNVDWASEENPSYMTVSHKWKSGAMMKLLKCNLGVMHQGFELQTLPAVFRDAVVLARALRIRYVWIDALCIVQDDEDELRGEISNMGHIYRNAVLNVGALQAADFQHVATQEAPGLFVDRNPQDFSPFALRIQRTGFKGDCFAYQKDTDEQLNWSSLMRRGWVLQERLLSRRSIYFGQQIWWECGQQLAREPFPDQTPITLTTGGRPGRETPYRVTNFLISRSTNVLQDMIYKRWLDIVETFSLCELSFEQDYLVALSGLAQEFAIKLGDQYYAGLWGKDMFSGLLWHRVTGHYDNDGARPREYRGAMPKLVCCNFANISKHLRGRGRLSTSLSNS
jgi:hypothetical protein